MTSNPKTSNNNSTARQERMRKAEAARSTYISRVQQRGYVLPKFTLSQLENEKLVVVPACKLYTSRVLKAVLIVVLAGDPYPADVHTVKEMRIEIIRLQKRARRNMRATSSTSEEVDDAEDDDVLQGLVTPQGTSPLYLSLIHI